VTAVQMLTSFLDLAGVFTIALVASTALGNSSGAATSSNFSFLSPINEWVHTGPREKILWLLAIAGGILVAKSFLNIYFTRLSLSLLAVRQAQVSGDLTSRLLTQPMLFITSYASQAVAYSLTSGVNSATLVVLGQAQIFATEVVLLGLLTTGLFLVSPGVTVFATLFFVVVAFAMHRLLSQRASALGLSAAEIEIQSVATLQEVIGSYREISVANRRAFYIQKFQSLRHVASTVQAGQTFVGVIPKYVLEITLILGGGLLVLSQLISRDLDAAIGVIALFLAAGTRVLPSILRLQSAVLAIRSAAGQASPTYELASALKAAPQEPMSIAINELDGRYINLPTTRNFEPSLSMSEVSFRYPDSETLALDSISFSTPSGSSLAIAGATGSGKSTLADVALGLLTPTSGVVQIGSLAPKAAMQLWPGAIAYVPQHVSLANTTVRENVALGLPHELIDDERVWEVLALVKLDKYLLNTRSGLETTVGEHGVKLSGGQRQRLGLARALYSNPSLIVLDEATSALDGETESLITRTLDEMHGKVTTLVIAHRLSTIIGSDSILFIQSGKVEAQGSFEDLKQENSSFAKQAKIMGL
jgi:ABC-type multidrug transport system fused ATPase/permease subunit